MSMISFKDLKTGEETESVCPAVFALGNFDGVHLGHAKVLRATAAVARGAGFRSAAWFFGDNPRPGTAVLTEPEEKTALFASHGIDFCAAETFSAVKDLSPGEFVGDYLPSLGCRGVVCGFNFRFGKGAAGDTNLLEKLCLGSGLSFKCVPPVRVGNVTVSSTAIRDAIEKGDAEVAASMLGRYYSLTAPVTHGRTLGTKFGFPTINQRFEEGRAVPRHGVYFTLTRIGCRIFHSVSNVGSRPTVGGRECRLETHLIGFEGDLYGEAPTVSFVKFRRPEAVFDSENSLIEAIKADKAAAENFFAAFEKEPKGEPQ